MTITEHMAAAKALADAERATLTPIDALFASAARMRAAEAAARVAVAHQAELAEALAAERARW